MKKLIVICLFSFFISCNQSNTASTGNKADATGISTSVIDNPHTASGIDSASLKTLPYMVFSDTMHNFGVIHEGDIVTYSFHFRNEGQKPLIISSANPSCGCTVAAIPQAPLMPGAVGVIKVQFNSHGHPGHQEKSITVASNSRNGTEYLYLKADVTPKDK